LAKSDRVRNRAGPGKPGDFWAIFLIGTRHILKNNRARKMAGNFFVIFRKPAKTGFFLPDLGNFFLKKTGPGNFEIPNSKIKHFYNGGEKANKNVHLRKNFIRKLPKKSDQNCLWKKKILQKMDQSGKN
jgi:hypothetical protein